MRRIMMLMLTGGLAAGCAVQPGSPELKMQFGEAPPPAFEKLNYAVDFGRRCSPPDTEGRRYVSLVWLRANRSDGSYAPLRAAADNCGTAVAQNLQ